MARPTLLKPDVTALIESIRLPGLPVPALHKLLVAAGGTISIATLRRYLAKSEFPTIPAPPAPASIAAIDRRAVAALEAGDDLDELRISAREIGQARAMWASTLGVDRGSVLAHSKLTERGVELARAIRALSPAPTPDPSRDPANVAAKARLLALVDEVLARDT